MNSEQLDAMRSAVELLMKNNMLDKLEGKDWKVYRVGTNIRVDIKYLTEPRTAAGSLD